MLQAPKRGKNTILDQKSEFYNERMSMISHTSKTMAASSGASKRASNRKALEMERAIIVWDFKHVTATWRIILIHFGELLHTINPLESRRIDNSHVSKFHNRVKRIEWFESVSAGFKSESIAERNQGWKKSRKRSRDRRNHRKVEPNEWKELGRKKYDLEYDHPDE